MEQSLALRGFLLAAIDMQSKKAKLLTKPFLLLQTLKPNNVFLPTTYVRRNSFPYLCCVTSVTDYIDILCKWHTQYWTGKLTRSSKAKRIYRLSSFGLPIKSLKKAFLNKGKKSILYTTLKILIIFISDADGIRWRNSVLPTINKRFCAAAAGFTKLSDLRTVVRFP